MIHNSKEKHDFYVIQLLNNIQNDEATYNIDTRKAFVEHEHVCGVMYEEVNEVKEAAKEFENLFIEYAKMVQRNFRQEELTKQLERIRNKALHLAQEAGQVGGICIKANKQLGRDWDGNEG